MLSCNCASQVFAITKTASKVGNPGVDFFFSVTLVGTLRGTRYAEGMRNREGMDMMDY
jgi:hypothetical protein